MHLTCCGINHHKGTLAERELFQLQRPALAQADADFKQLSGASEAAIVATCSRIEFYRVDDQKVDPRGAVMEFYRKLNVDTELLESILFVKQETSAARHLYKITAGLDSLLLGETQVLGQVKEAYSSACSVGGAGKILHKLFHHAFQVAKRIHAETDISSGATGIAGAATELVKQHGFDKLKGLNAVIVGANRSAEMVLSRLTREGAEITLANRTVYKAEKLVRPFGATAVPLSDLTKAVQHADLLFSATSAPGYIVTPEMLQSRDPDLPLLAIDLAVPRDIYPDIANLPEVTLFDLEDLKRHLNEKIKEHLADLPYALDLIEEQVNVFDVWKRSLATDNRSELRQLLDEDRRMIVDKFRDNFRDGEAKALDAFSRNLYKQFLRRITSK